MKRKILIQKTRRERTFYLSTSNPPFCIYVYTHKENVRTNNNNIPSILHQIMLHIAVLQKHGECSVHQYKNMKSKTSIQEKTHQPS